MRYVTHSGLRVTVLAAFSVFAVAGGLAGCFSERVAGSSQNPDLCIGTRENVVRIINFNFDPVITRVSPGTEITWVNCDDESHTSTSDTGAWESGFLARNATFKRRFDTAGRFAYHCTPHPFMTASVVVE